jgi:hypothetical protein
MLLWNIPWFMTLCLAETRTNERRIGRSPIALNGYRLLPRMAGWLSAPTARRRDVIHTDESRPVENYGASFSVMSNRNWRATFAGRLGQACIINNPSLNFDLRFESPARQTSQSYPWPPE